jgi:4-hydroxybutyrate dehydrogenase
MTAPVLKLPLTFMGPGARRCLARELLALGLAKPLLVTDRGLAAAGIVARVLAELEGFGVIPVMDDVTENPLFSDADRGADLFRANGCDAVIALGGGSVIDTAKYIAQLAASGGAVAGYFSAVPRPSQKGVPLFVLPTTAGTGSEASPDAGIHPDATSSSVGMHSLHIVPDVAILDPELTTTLPPRLTAATGIDAISHCVEGYLASQTTSLTDAILLDGIAKAVEALPAAIRRGDDLEAREALMLAAYAGGIGIGMGLGPAHAVAISCGDQGFHHGLLSGIGLVCTLDQITPYAPARAAALGKALGAGDGVSLSGAVARMMRELGLPATLGELGYAARDIAALGEAAHASPFNLSARHHFSAADYTSMIEQSLKT